MQTKLSPRFQAQSVLLKVLTYNVHSCIGTDRRLDVARVADAIASTGADVIALQELDVGRKRSGGIDQAEAIASLLKMRSHFHAALHVEDERYGDAILTALPTQLMRAGPLPSIGETRGALWVRVEVGGAEIDILNTHLGLRNFDRRRQAEQLMGPDWMGSADFGARPFLICGDLNAVPNSSAYSLLARRARDAQRLAAEKVGRTFPSRFPLLRLDHIFVSDGLSVEASQVIDTPLTRRASDHLPLMAVVAVPLRRRQGQAASLAAT